MSKGIKTIAAAEKVLQKIGNLQNEMTQLSNQMGNEILAVKQGFTKKIINLDCAIQELTQDVTDWANENREKLQKGKSITLAAGKISWRKSPDQLEVINDCVAIERLQKHENGDYYIQKRYTLNKRAILKSPDIIRSIGGTVTNGEETCSIKLLTGEEIK